MESFLNGEDPEQSRDKNLEYSSVIDPGKLNNRLYLQAKEMLKSRLTEVGIQRTMPHLANKPIFQPSNIIPKRVIQGYQFYETRLQDQNVTTLQRNRLIGNANMNELSSIGDMSMNQPNPNKSGLRLPRLTPLDGKNPSSVIHRRSQSVVRGTSKDNKINKTDARMSILNYDSNQPEIPNLNESIIPRSEDNQNLNISAQQISLLGNNNSILDINRKKPLIKLRRDASPKTTINPRPQSSAMNTIINKTDFNATHTMGNPTFLTRKNDISFDEQNSKIIIDKLTGRNIPALRTLNMPNKKRSMSIKSRASSFMIEGNDDVIPVGNILQGINMEQDDQPPMQNVGSQINKLQDVDSFIYLIKEKQINPSEFIYLTKREDDHYNLRLADFVTIKENVYYTLSSNGVTRYEKGLPVEFITLKDWLRERDQYNHIKQLTFFTQFRAWKTLKKWVKILKRNHRNMIISQLNEKLFIANPIFQQLLLNHKSMCLEIERLRFVELMRLETGEIQSLDDFKLNQEKKRSYVVESLQTYSQNLHQNVRAGVRMILERLRDHIVNEMANDEDQFNEELKALASDNKEKRRASERNKFEELGFPPFLNYVHRSMLRHECSRFLRLAYLLDFMTTESLGNMYIGSVDDFVKKLKDLFNACEEIPTLGNDSKKQIMEPLFYVSVEMNPVEVEEKKIEQEEIGLQIQNPEDFDLMTFAQFEKEYEPDPKAGAQGQGKPRRRRLPEEEEEEDERILTKRHIRNLHSIWFNLAPTLEHFQDEIENFFDVTVEGIKVIERFSKNKEFEPYAQALEEWDEVIGDSWEMPENKHLEILWYLKESQTYRTFKNSISNTLEVSFERMDIFLENFNYYLNFYWRDTHTDFTILANERLRKQSFVYDMMLKLYRELVKTFEEGVIEATDLGPFRVELNPVKKIIAPKPKERLKFIEDYLADILRKRIIGLKDWLDSSIKKLSKMVSGINDFIEQKNHHIQISFEYEDKKVSIEQVGEMFELLQNNEIHMTNQDREQYVSLQAMVAQFVGVMHNAELSSNKNNDRFTKVLAEMIEKFQADVTDYMEQSTNEEFILPTDDIEARLHELNSLERKVKEIENTKDDYKRFEEVLQVNEYSNFSHVDQLKNEVTLRILLWKTHKEWSEVSKGWTELPFAQINSKELGQKAEQFTKNVYRIEKNLPESSVIQDLKKSVHNFRESIPVVTALRSQYLKESHWEEIRKILKTDFDIQEVEFTLQKLLDMHVSDFQEEILNVATQATQEHALEGQIIDLEAEWKTRDLVMKNYKDLRDTYIIGDIEEITMVLEEALATINNILASRYVKNLRARAEKVQNDLLMLEEIIDKWMECQKKWMYLENIFQGPDIKKQLAHENTLFEQSDRALKTLFKRAMLAPNTMRIIKIPNIIETLNKTSETLDIIEKHLEDYLEVKRGLFPRFYFISNDELLEILAKSQNVEIVQKHLPKLFENINKLDLKNEGRFFVVAGMISAEGENVPFNKSSLQARGNVETWLDSIQRSMFDVLQKLLKEGFNEYIEGKFKSRNDWVLNHYGQVVSVICHVIWCWNTQDAIAEVQNNPDALEENYNQNLDQLGKLTELVRSNISSLQRKIVVALITQDVHARDIVEKLKADQVDTINHFTWQQQLRYYWENDKDTCTVKQVTAVMNYGYEYLGATSRLVITPLTDRCWITITGALNLSLGAAPAGPAGTGKTESTKDLAKGLGVLCVVFNCSDQITTQMMSKLFSGLAQQGAWTCLDEFNRIDIEVLSVIAQQLLIIRLALLNKQHEFEFEGRMMPLKNTCGVFITMNPGYAGRTELPDNLKVLFRPVAMMIPDYGLIAEIMLFAEGFQNAKDLSKKMVQLYKLSSEQLSQQDHYDFGMRAVKSVLVMAGSLKRAEKDLDEDVVLIRAMRDSNVPKFIKEDLPLFQALIKDLFPQAEIPPVNYGDLQTQIIQSISFLGLQRHSEFELKVVQLFETFNVRFGVMIVGPTGSGKSKCYRVLQHAMTSLKKAGSKDTRFQIVNIHPLNPKSISMGELYGEVNPYTQEWQDGLGASIVRTVNLPRPEDSEQKEWVVFDGPVDALWIENMNTVLDDNQTLCLANGERIKLRNQLRMLFEVQDLAVASPATVSRCGMVYMNHDCLGWEPYVKSWMEANYSSTEIIPHKRYYEYILHLFKNTIDPTLEKMKRYCKEPIPTVGIQLARNVCNILEAYLTKAIFKSPENVEKNKTRLSHIFVFAFIWGMGGSLDSDYHMQFDNIVKDTFKSINYPRGDTVFDYFLDTEKDFIFGPWAVKVPEFVYSKETSYSELLVPTADTTKYSSMLELLILKSKPTFLTGFTGVGKSLIVQKLLFKLKEESSINPVFLNFSAQTSSYETQIAIESKLNKKFRSVYGARPGEKIAIFIDDINMPAPEVYGAQPAIELLRQYLDYSGFYDRQKLFMKTIEDTVLICSGAPPGGGRNVLSQRFTRHFNILCLAKQSDKTLESIFGQILKGFLAAWSFPENIKRIAESIVEGTVEIFTKISRDLLPTPTRFHYTFNLRDISKVFQGMLMIKPQACNQAEDLIKLWIHENCRVFQDRLINNDDKTWFGNVIVDILLRTFKLNWKIDRVIGREKPVFGDLLKLEAPQQPYEEIKDKTKLIKVLDAKQEEHNLTSNQKLGLVFFEDAVEHIVRICRILKQPKGNAMLIGVGGSGKQSLSRLSSFIREYQTFQIELTKNYNKDSFKEDMINLMIKTGVDRIPVTFTFTDSQISDETFLEYINNLLNTGEIPNLFSKKEDYEDIINRVRPYNKQLKRIDSPDVIYSTFVQTVQENLHIVLCMSPVGDKLRIRCRKFPSLVNCCTLDWFAAWPEDALTSVAFRLLGDIDLPSEAMRTHLAETLCRINIDVEEKSKRFYAELKRKVYNTPKSYLDAIQLYITLLDQKRSESNKMRYKLREGIEKLKSTNELVAKLKVSLTELQPQLAEQQEKTEIFLAQLARDTKIANEKEQSVQVEVERVNVQAEEITKLTKEAQADLAKVMPLLIEAEQALKALDKREVSEIRSFNNPPDAVRLVMEAVCVLLNEKPDWPTAKLVLMDIGFLDRLNNYDRDNVPESILKKLRVYTKKPEFEPEYVGQKNLACKSICLWCRAIDNYSVVNKEAGPKKQKVEDMSKKLDLANKELSHKKAELQEVRNNLEKMQKECDDTMIKKEALAEDIQKTQQRLARAAKLTELLADEGVRWQEQLQTLNVEYEKLVGNVFVSGVMMSYLGPFTGSYRKEMNNEWLEWIKEFRIPHSDDFALAKVGGDPLEIRYWTLNALPTDNVSIDNAIMTKLCNRWPLLIDPQIQANKWIKQIEKENKLTIMKFSDHNLIKKMQTAINSGYPVLIEDVGEELEPSIDPVMQKLIQNHDGRAIMRVGDMLVDYNPAFRLYLTTKMSNPHYLPEVCIRVTLINFTVTFEGLQDQLLGDVVKLERPDVEKQRDEIVVSVSSLKKSLKELQDRILELLANSKGMILDDQNLIFALDDSKIKSAEISQNLEENQQVEVVIEETRQAYIPVAIRGTILYFVVADLSGIDSMYQYSLAYYKRLFSHSIETSEKFDNLDQRLEILIQNITKNVYVNVCRGLFEAHKKIFSFLITTSINRKNGTISELEWNLFIRGPPQSALAGSTQPNPHPKLISNHAWEILQYMSTALKPFYRMAEDFTYNLHKWEGYLLGDDLYEEKIANYDHIEHFKKLLLIRVLRPENIVLSIGQYVSDQLGKFYEETVTATMEEVYVESDCRTPVIFILSQGADPSNQLIKFAKDKGFERSFVPLSLGQGQGKKAEVLIQKGTKEGLWILLQNCHLARSWMPNLEKIVENLASNFDEQIHKDFRLFLTSMPADYFPVSVLQNGLKLTTEPPRGLKANLKRSYMDFSQNMLDQCDKPELWRKMLFGLSFFHAIVQERRKFGPLGFNIRYEFNESDLDVSCQTLKMFLNETEDDVPWDALIYVTGQINYGGRVTDDWDRHCLLSILKKYYTIEISSDDYAFSDSGIYFAPKDGAIEVYREYIESLPLNDNPEAFGLHENANIAFLTQESNKILDAILAIQPRLADNAQEKSSDEIVSEIANNLMKDVPVNFNQEHGNKKLFERNEVGLMSSLSTFLLQELEKFNNLLNVIRDSLDQLVKAIKGFIVMSQELDEMYTAFLNNQLPNNWKKVSYPSLKPLGAWYQDLLERVAFLDNWFKNDQPPSYWLSGFFFPQGFITGVLQTHARKYKIPIDKLNFKFKVLHPSKDNAQNYPKDGVYIYGLFLDGARWDTQHESLIDQVPGELFTKMPTIHFIPMEGYQPSEDLYRCPVYKTSVRVGVLSTTGQSTNFILPVDLPSKYERPEFWTLRGTALLCQLDN